MSLKVNKNGKGYPVGILPQQIIDDVFDLTSNTYTIPSASTALVANTPVSFTAPSYGYLTVYSTNPDTRVVIKAEAGGNSLNMGNAKAVSSSEWDYATLYMRKGMTVTVSANGNSGAYRFTSFN